MSDDKLRAEEHDDAESLREDSENISDAKKSNVPPAVALAFVIIALLGVLLATLPTRTGAITAKTAEKSNSLQ